MKLMGYTTERCKNCGSRKVVTDIKGKERCGRCQRPRESMRARLETK